MIHLQVIATAPDDCLVAQACGADSIELCSALELGGLTPSIGLMRAARRLSSLPIHAMLRPRPGGSVYTENEFALILEDAAALVNAGCNGLVCAFVTAAGQLDESRCRQLRAQFPEQLLTYHRAFDLLPNPAEAILALRKCGFNGVLTSGRQATALEGAAAIRALRAQAEGALVVIAGSGVTPDNARVIAEATGCTALHGSFSKYVDDPSLAALPGYRFGTQPERMRVLDGEQVRAARAALDTVGSTR